MPARILAVDDDLAVLELLEIMLEQLGCEVLALSDSRQAAERVNHQEFDGILLDAHMPHLNGLELARLIRNSARNRTVPIVMLTAGQGAHDTRSGLQGLITFFAGKPFDMGTLKDVLAGIATSAEKAQSTPA